MSNNADFLQALVALLRSARVEDRRDAVARLTWHPLLKDAISDLVKALEDTDEDVSGQAGFALDEHPELFRRAIPSLLQLLRHPASRVRVRTLSRFLRQHLDEGCGAAIFPVLELLDDPDSEVRNLAATVLRQITSLALRNALAQEVLSLQDCIERLDSAERMSRMRACFVLGEHGSAGQALLINVVQTHPDPATRRAAALSLSRTRSDPSAWTPGALKDTDAVVRLLALRTLRGHKQAPISTFQLALHDEDPWVRHTAALGLAARGSEAIVAVGDLTEALRDSDTWVLGAVLDAVEAVGPQARVALPRLIQLLQDPEPLTRWAAASALGSSLAGYAQSALPFLLRLVEDSDETVRYAATTSVLAICRHLPDPDAVSHIITALLTHEDRTVRQITISALSRLARDVEFAIPLLASALRDPSAEVRVLVAEGLFLLGRKAVSVVQPLLQALRDREPKVKRWAVLTLEEIGAEALEAVPALIALLRDSDPEVRYFASRAVLSIRGHDPAMLPTILELLGSEDSDIRRQAAEALGNLGIHAASALPVLQEMLRGKEDDEAVIAALRQAIRYIEAGSPSE